ncbi:MAG: lysophospholipid acyltransferase family protein [Chloroflexi bacterium]|nr:lysophospholipid acyltransferase family protein [Chloroflexota bacterium]
MSEPPSSAHTGVEYSPLERPTTGRVGRIVQRSRERSAVLAYRGTSATLGHTPTRLSEAAARALFLGSYFAWASKRRIVRGNVAHVLGLPADHPDVQVLARRTYTSYSRFVVELMRLPTLPVDEPLRLLPPTTPAHTVFSEVWTRNRAEGRGVIAASGHIGNIEIFAGSYALQGIPTWGLADDTAYPELFALLNAQRARWGVRIIPWRNLRQLFSVMRRPAALGMVVDWGYRPDDVPVRMFGAWTTLPAGPATLAARTRATILPVAAFHQRDGYTAHAAPPIEVVDGSPRSVAIATQAIADALEGFVRRAPEQWHTFKPMWPATVAEQRLLEARAMTMLADAAEPRARRASG